MPNKNCIYDFSAHLTGVKMRHSNHAAGPLATSSGGGGVGVLHVPPTPPNFGRSVDHISTREPDCAHLITTCPTDLQTF